MAMFKDPEILPVEVIIEVVRYEPPPSPVWPCVIFDFDGTLCPTTKRDPFLRKSYRCDPLTEGLEEYHRAIKHGYKVVIVTVRAEFWRKHTESWLANHGIYYDGLYMRATRDRRDDVTVKRDLYDRLMEDGFVPVRAIEDNSFVAKMWESLGIETTLVGDA